MSECRCTMRETLVGDGCSKCNPDMALQIAQDNLEEAEERIKELEEEKARIWGAIDAGSERYKARIKGLEAVAEAAVKCCEFIPTYELHLMRGPNHELLNALRAAGYLRGGE